MMIKKFTKLLFVNSNFYIKTKTGFQLIDAKPLAIHEQDFYLHKNKIGFWAVIEGVTGCRVTKYYRNPIQSVKELKKAIGFKTPQQLESKILSNLKTKALCPRYKFIANPCRNVVFAKN